MKTIKYFSLVLFAAIFLVSCAKDGDLITTDGGGEVALNGNTADIVLDYNRINDLALTLHWTDNGELTLSNPLVAAPDGATTNILQLSGDENFESVYEILKDKGIYYHQFTVYELNAVINQLGFADGVASRLYIRIKSLLGANMPERYSSIMTIKVTPYKIDKTLGYILDSSKQETGVMLASVESDGVYSGFVGAGGWYNFFLKEGDGVIWGNDGVTGMPFALSSESTQWNFWYPGQSGCYYTIVDTKAKEWSALFIEKLTLGGDLTGDMEYDRKKNRWFYTFDADQSGNFSITIKGTGKQYDVQTGTDDALAVSREVAFGEEGGKIVFGTVSNAISINFPSKGQMTLFLDLANPKEWICGIETGGGEVEEVPQKLFISGIDDGISGNWTFDRYLTLYDKDNRAYSGVINVKSLWGYRFYLAHNEWNPYYTMAVGGTAEKGTLVMNGEGNIAAPSEGVYLLDVSMEKLTYTTTAVSAVSYTGFNDNWALTDMSETETPGVYVATVNITAATPWGFQIVLNKDWNQLFGCGDGVLVYKRNKGNPSVDLTAGTYTLTVDLCAGTYSIK